MRVGEGAAAAGGRVGVGWADCAGVVLPGPGNQSVGEGESPSLPGPKIMTVVVTVGTGLGDVGRPGGLAGGWSPGTVAVTVAVDVTMVTLVRKTVDTAVDVTAVTAVDVTVDIQTRVDVRVKIDVEVTPTVVVALAPDVTTDVEVTTDVDVTMVVATAVLEIVVVSVNQTTEVAVGAEGKLVTPPPPLPASQAPNDGLQPDPQYASPLPQ